jgi:L-fuconolactonase
MAKKVYDTFGAGRLMWGTDWPIHLPYASYANIVALYRNNLDFMPEADRQQILHGTVQKVWPFGV